MASAKLHKGRKSLYSLVIFVAFFTFTADIVDLREELLILPSAASSLDSDITTGMVSAVAFQSLPMVASFLCRQCHSLKISFRHLLPCGLRAPPFSS